MPELPEVETIAKGLAEVLCNKVITKVDFLSTKLREEIPIKAVKKVLEGHKIKSIFRRAKYIIIQTPKGLIFSHLGMTGKFLNLKELSAKEKHTHLILTYKKQKTTLAAIHYVDPRRFGRMTAISSFAWEKHPWFVQNGCEPLEEKNLGTYLSQKASTKSLAIKSFLMDSKVLVGVGNIYACEALFAAKIHPETPAKALTTSKWQDLAYAIKKILKKAIKEGGTSIRDFRKLENQKGYFKQSLFVYGREKEPCLKCKKTVKRLIQAGRSSFFCPSCQKQKEENL